VLIDTAHDISFPSALGLTINRDCPILALEQFNPFVLIEEGA